MEWDLKNINQKQMCWLLNCNVMQMFVNWFFCWHLDAILDDEWVLGDKSLFENDRRWSQEVGHEIEI